MEKVLPVYGDLRSANILELESKKLHSFYNTINCLISRHDNVQPILEMFCTRENMCIYQTQLMYNDKILDKVKTLRDQCDISEHILTFQVIKTRNEIIELKDLVWTHSEEVYPISWDMDTVYIETAILPEAKIIVFLQ